MAKRKQLSDRQTAVLEDLFDSDLDEQGVLAKHRVRQSTYDKWLTEKPFAKQFSRYVTRARRRSELLLAKYCCLAAAKLVELTASKKGETARKACWILSISQGSQLRPRGKKRTVTSGSNTFGCDGQQIISGDGGGKKLEVRYKQKILRVRAKRETQASFYL
ncbi:MAG: hypothetical protein WAK60_12000 [Sedimentisphaerales bacterium]